MKTKKEFMLHLKDALNDKFKIIFLGFIPYKTYGVFSRSHLKQFFSVKLT